MVPVVVSTRKSLCIAILDRPNAGGWWNTYTFIGQEISKKKSINVYLYLYENPCNKQIVIHPIYFSFIYWTNMGC